VFQPVFNRGRDRYEVHSGVTLATSAARLLLALEEHPWLLPCTADAIAQLPGPIALPFALLCMEAGSNRATDNIGELGHAIRETHIAQLERDIPIGPHQRRQYRVLSLIYPAYGDRQPTQRLGELSVCVDRDADGIDIHFHRGDDSLYGWTELLTDLLVGIREQPAGMHDLLWDLPGALCWRAAMSLYDRKAVPEARFELFQAISAAATNRCRALPHQLMSVQCRYVRAYGSHPINSNN